MQFENEFFRTLLDNVTDAIFFVDNDRIITFWNRAAERLTGYSSAEVIGERCHEHILRHVDEQGRSLCEAAICPTMMAMRERRAIESDLYLHHKDGHRVAVHICVMPMFNGGGEVVGAAQIFSDAVGRSAVGQRVKELEKMAMVDSLTTLANRRFIEVNLHARLAAMQRYGWTFGVLFIDIDRFKNVNDTYGHDVGDHVLKMVSKTLLNSLRPFDVVGRWGGEEFVAIILNTAEDQIYGVANRYRALIEQSGFNVGSNVVKVTVSIGATIARPEDTVDALLKRADQLLYMSKAAGRNCVTVKLDGQA